VKNQIIVDALLTAKTLEIIVQN